jgi:hypothetical protein
LSGVKFSRLSITDRKRVKTKLTDGDRALAELPPAQRLLGRYFYYFGLSVAELNRTNLSQSISPLSLQNIFENSLVNLLIICEYDFTKSSFFSLALYPIGSMISVNSSL